MPYTFAQNIRIKNSTGSLCYKKDTARSSEKDLSRRLGYSAYHGTRWPSKQSEKCVTKIKQNRSSPLKNTQAKYSIERGGLSSSGASHEMLCSQTHLDNMGVLNSEHDNSAFDPQACSRHRPTFSTRIASKLAKLVDCNDNHPRWLLQKVPP